MKAAPALVLAAAALGAAVRLLSGQPILQTDLVVGADTRATPPEGGAEAAVYAFYESIGGGDYERAWELSLEPAWPGSGGVSYGTGLDSSSTLAGWTSKEDFVARCREDMGDGLRLKALSVAKAAAPPGGIEPAIGAALRDARIVPVRASGQLLGACLIYRWDRDLSVAEVDGRYRVILPGTKAAKALFHQSWFSDLSLVGSLRGAKP